MNPFTFLRDKLLAIGGWLSSHLKWAVPYFQTLIEVVATAQTLWIFFGLICLTANITFLTAPMILFLCATISIGYGLIQLYWKKHEAEKREQDELQAMQDARTLTDLRDHVKTFHNIYGNKIATLERQVKTLLEANNMAVAPPLTPRTEESPMSTSTSVHIAESLIGMFNSLTFRKAPAAAPPENHEPPNNDLEKSVYEKPTGP